MTSLEKLPHPSQYEMARQGSGLFTVEGVGRVGAAVAG